MRKISLLLAFIMLLSSLAVFSSCNKAEDGVTSDIDSNETIVMQYGDIVLTDSEYKYIASYIKDAIIYNQKNYLYQYTGQVYEEADILAMQIDENKTVADYIREYSVEFAQQMIITEKLCADANISITEQSDIDKIDGYVSDIEYAYGGEDLFEIELVKKGFSRSGIERFQKFYVLHELLYDARYGENGFARISDESIKKHFVENYFKYDGVMYSYINGTDGSPITFEFSDEEINAYFNKNYVKVRHILYKTVDSTGKKLSEDVVAQKKATAEAATNSIKSGEKTFDDFKDQTEDVQHEYVFTYGKMVKEFEKASFEMAVGETRLVETEYGYHIIEKLEMTDTDLNGVADEKGEVKGSRKNEVVTAMSTAKIHDEAMDTLSKLNDGTLEKYPEQDKEKAYYVPMGSSFIDKNDANYASLVDILKNIELGVYTEKVFSGDATYILRNIAFTEDDITDEIYSSIEETMAVEAYSEYVQTFYDSVVINKEFVDNFDIISLPLLDEEFYVEQ